jgi:hypothetical protein
MQYPLELIPRIFYKKIRIEKISNRSIFLIRHTPSTPSTLPGSNNINPKFVCEPRANMNDLSLNILGKYREFHIKIKLSKGATQYNADWKELQRGVVPKEDDVEQDNNRGFFYISLDSLHGHRIPKDESSPSDFQVKCEVIHKPTKCNFWHVQLQWVHQGKIISRNNPIWTRPLQTATRAMAARFARPELEGFGNVKWYDYWIIVPYLFSDALSYLDRVNSP